jgi:hypothetical protein
VQARISGQHLQHIARRRVAGENTANIVSKADDLTPVADVDCISQAELANEYLTILFDFQLDVIPGKLADIQYSAVEN